ncbi:MAG: hypothetical protein ACTSRZ_09825 [Promethearchaeota archaeon]
MAIDITSLIILIATFLIFLVFLLYDSLGRDEPYGNFSYIIAIFPSSYLWYIVTLPDNRAQFESFGVIGVWAVLVMLWYLSLIRDLILVKKKKKDIDDVGLYLFVGLIVQLIATAVLPADNVVPSMNYWVNKVLFFYLPDITGTMPESQLIWLNIFRIGVTILIITYIIPLIIELKGETINMWVLLIITLIFSFPFALICWLWLPEAWGALLFLVDVLFFILLLMIARGKSNKK